MKFGTFAATAFAVATVGIAAGTANAKPLNEVPKDVSTSGVEQEVAYESVLSDHGRESKTTIAGGRFAITDNGTAVTLKSDTGAVVAVVPLAYEVAGRKLPVAQEIADNGHKLTLTPKVDAKDIGELNRISSMERLTNELNKNVAGMVGGGALGAIIGTILGFGFFSIITGPIGLIVGSIAGGAIMGGEPLTEAVMAVLTGQP